MKKNNLFYISPAKQKRLEGRLCRTKATVAFYGKDGFDSRIKLDSDKFDNIGVTEESLRKYLDYLVGDRKLYYNIEKWSINTY